MLITRSSSVAPFPPALSAFRWSGCAPHLHSPGLPTAQPIRSAKKHKKVTLIPSPLRHSSLTGNYLFLYLILKFKSSRKHPRILNVHQLFLGYNSPIDNQKPPIRFFFDTRNEYRIRWIILPPLGGPLYLKNEK